ncbi:MAG: DUF2180 family protein [Methanoregulaceae archaeon]|nr:DUF2180 family protein [Methanoregulaceae archaeon]
MKCYICEEMGGDSEAVSICIVCGMGLCRRHAIRNDLEIWEGGYPFPAKKKGMKLARILCKYCDAALRSS